jgi:hypothetical protein
VLRDGELGQRQQRDKRAAERLQNFRVQSLHGISFI